MNKLIFKKANKYNMFLIEDGTDQYWDQDSKYNKLIVKFIQLTKNNSTKKIIKTFVDVEEFRNVLSIINNSKFIDVFKNSDKKDQGISKSFYGGSHKGLALERGSDGLRPIIDGMEARILKFDLKTKEGSPFFRVSAAISDGKKGRNGTIVFTNSNRDQLYYDFALEDIYLMCNTVLEYLRAKQTVALNSYFNPSRRNSYVKLVKKLKDRVGEDKFKEVLGQNYMSEAELNSWSIEEYKQVINALKKIA